MFRLLIYVVTSTLLLNCGPLKPSPEPKRQTLFHQTHAAMGTVFTVDLYADDQATAAHSMDLAFEEIDRLEALLSNYRPSSELSRISREAALMPVVTDPETFSFLVRSLYWSRQSNGAFDITVGPLLRAWGFFKHGGRIPSELELRALRSRIGWERIHLDPRSRSVSFDPPAPLELDPGSIGKGFAVDSVVSLLRANGVRSALISAGESTIFAIGTPPGGQGWPINIPDPRQPNTVAVTVHLRDTSLSSGACTQKFFIRDNHRYCHIFNPQTLRPVEGVLQTTVIDPSATDSDALSTIAFVLPETASRKVFESLRGARALIFHGPASSRDCVAINWKDDPCRRDSPSAPKEARP